MPAFILPTFPTLRKEPPKGEGWVHEVKFDGYRAQLAKDGKSIVIYSRNGKDFTSRFESVAQALRGLPCKSAIIDAEIVACNTQGLPDFELLHSRKFKQESLCAWCFDILHYDGKDMRQVPLAVRRMRLSGLIKRTEDDFLRFSEGFDDAAKLLKQCEKLNMEGIVSKRKDAPYRSGKGDWFKVKCTKWTEQNRDRGERLFGEGR